MADTVNGWYFMDHGWRGKSIIHGPFTEEQILSLFKKGDINEKTQVRYGLKSPWLPLRETPTFSGSVSRHQLNIGGPEFWKKHKKWIIAVAVVFCIVLIARMQAPSSHIHKYGKTVVHPLQEALNRGAIISLTNKTRELNGLPSLSESPLLNAIAESRVRDMFEKQYFDHISPAGEQVSDMAQKIGYRYRIISENIGMGNFLTNQKVIDGWMQSPGHRKNILSSEVEEMGAAIVKGNINGRKAWISVQIFGLQSKPVSN